jgi:hypothetical protein
MTTLQGVAERSIANFPTREEFEQHISDIPGRWLPQVGQVLEWTRTWLAAWNRHDLDELTGLVTEDLVWSDPIMAGDVVTGRAEFREYIETFWRGFPDIVFSITGPPHLGLDGLRMAVPWRMQGRMLGELAWWGTRYDRKPPTFAPTNRAADIEGYDFYEFRDGLLAKYTIVCDFLMLSQQLGLAPDTESRMNAVMMRVQHLTAPMARRRADKERSG